MNKKSIIMLLTIISVILTTGYVSSQGIEMDIIGIDPIIPLIANIENDMFFQTPIIGNTRRDMNAISHQTLSLQTLLSQTLSSPIPNKEEPLGGSALVNILLIAISGTLVCIGVHFIPVGGAPAAMAQATGIGTGTVELAAGSGLVGLISAAYMNANAPEASMSLILASGAMGSMIMIASTMFAGSLIYAYGVGTPFASAQVKKDPITGERQDIYMSKGTQGHGLPTVCFVSGIIGAAFGGTGGALIYYVLYGIYSPLISASSAAAVAGVFTIGVFYVNAVIPSYGVGGTIEGFHDPKFKRVIGKDSITSFCVSLICGTVAILIATGM